MAHTHKITLLILSVLMFPGIVLGQAADDLKMGTDALHAADLVTARPLLESAARDLPDSVEAQMALGECLLKLGQLDHALQQYQKVLKLSPDHAYAKVIVEALTGQRQSFEQKIASAQGLMRIGAYAEAAAFLGTFVDHDAASPGQRDTAWLLQLESLLWSGDQQNVLSGAMRLAENTSDATISGQAKIIAALALLRRVEQDRGAINQAENLVQLAGGLDPAWSSRAKLVRAFAQLPDFQTAVSASENLRAAFVQIPGTPYRHWAQNFAAHRLLQTASESMGQGAADVALQIVWPMISADPIPPANQVGQPIRMQGGWLVDPLTTQKLRARISRIFVYIGNVELQNSGHEATLFGYWLAAEYHRQTGSRLEGTEALLKLAKQLASLSRPAPKRQPGEVLSHADQLQRTILLGTAQRVTNAEQKSVLIKLIVEHSLRYEGVDDLATGLAQFVSVGGNGDAGNDQAMTLQLPEELTQLGPGIAYQQLLTELAQCYRRLGKRDFGRDAATLKQGANESLNRNDRIALLLLGQLQMTSVGGCPVNNLAEEIVQRYSAAGHTAAALNAIDIVYAHPQDDSGRWLTAEFKWEQAVKNETQRLASNRQLGDQLAPLVNEAISEIVKIVEGDPRPITREKGTALIQTMVNRYAGLQRFDLARAAVSAFVAAGDGNWFADWALWSRINLYDKQAAQSLASTSLHLANDQTAALDALHQSELELIDQLLANHADSQYRQPAVQRVMQISSAYQNLNSYEVATKILQDFLSTNAGLTNAEQIEYQVIQIAIQKARNSFAARDNKVKPPTELSAEYATCIEQLAAFLQAHPTGRYSGTAESALFNIIKVYAAAGAWDVARQVLDQFAAAIPDFRSPQHLKLLQAATWLGELDRQFGIDLLSPLPVTGPREPAFHSGPIEELAANVTTPPRAAGAELATREAVRQPGAGAGRGGEGVLGDQPTGGLDAMAVTMDDDLEDRFDADGLSILHMQTNAAPSETALAMIRQSQQRQFHQLAMMDNEAEVKFQEHPQNQGQQEFPEQSISLPTGSVLSEAEMKRQDDAADQAYAILLDIIRSAGPQNVAIQSNARAHMMWLFGFFEGQLRADRAIALIQRYLQDQPADPAKVALSFQAIHDQLVWAAQRQPAERVNLAWLDQRHDLFESARRSIEQFVADYQDEKEWVEKALLLTADSYQREAEMTSSVSRARAGGLMVRSVDALVTLLQTRPDHPHCAGFHTRMWSVAERLKALGQLDAAIYVFSQIPIHFPTDSLAHRSVLEIAQLHAVNLNQPLKAVETYQEFLSSNGDNEQIRSQIFSIAQQLANKQRYLESLHVFGVFVDSFPNDSRAAQALQAMGQTHQTNEAWEQAIQSYERILAEYGGAPIAPHVKLAVAECQINLSRWREARKLYEEFTQQYPQDGEVATAKARLDWLKKLDRYETLLADPQVTRHKDDAQFEIGRIVLSEFANPVKAIEEFDKTVRNFPDSDVADDAQLEIGKAYLSLGRMEDARLALLQLPAKFPTSPLADDALYLVAQSYEQQAARLATVTLNTARALVFDARQKFAYRDFNESVGRLQQLQAEKRSQLKSMGKSKELALDEAAQSFRQNSPAISGLSNTARRAEQQAETESALQVANRQDQINEANREAIALYMRAATDYPLGDKTDDSLLRVAQIFETQLKDRPAAMETYQKIVRLFPGTPVAEDAAWNVALFHEQEGRYELAAGALRDFIRNYPASGRIADAQYSLAEVLEELGRWIDAMDEYETFRQKFSDHPKARIAMDQINWIRTYRK